MDKPRIIALDGLRGIAILGVIITHLYTAPDLLYPWLQNIVWFGGHGVDLFFVLSGFLIGGILLDHPFSRKKIICFFIRRFFRIVPLYGITIFILVGLILDFPELAAPWWAYMTFTANITHVWQADTTWYPLSVIWSLCVEEQFYLLAPFIVGYIKRAHLLKILCITILFSWLLRYVLFMWGGEYALGAIHFLTPCRADAFSAGILVATMIRDEQFNLYKDIIGLHWNKFFGGCLILVSIYVYLDPTLGNIYSVLFGYSAVIMLSTLLIIGVVSVRPKWLILIMENASLRSLGKLSYFIYLWHLAIAYILGKILNPFNIEPSNVSMYLLSPLVITILTWFAAWLSWRCFEYPLIKIGRKFSYS